MTRPGYRPMVQASPPGGAGPRREPSTGALASPKGHLDRAASGRPLGTKGPMRNHECLGSLTYEPESLGSLDVALGLPRLEALSTMAVTDYTSHRWGEPDIEVLVAYGSQYVRGSSMPGGNVTTCGRRWSGSPCSATGTRTPAGNGSPTTTSSWSASRQAAASTRGIRRRRCRTGGRKGPQRRRAARSRRPFGRAAASLRATRPGLAALQLLETRNGQVEMHLHRYVVRGPRRPLQTLDLLERQLARIVRVHENEPVRIVRATIHWRLIALPVAQAQELSVELGKSARVGRVDRGV